jgi:uncharacterized protein (DUF1015 family)
MAKIHPFKAIRPTRDKVHLVATRPYYTYKKKVLHAKLEDNPFTFLHIINPEFGSLIRTEPNSVERFALVEESFNFFRENGVLIQEKVPSIYIYRQTTGNNDYIGIIAGASIEEYKNDSIKKHEATITSREKMFTDYLNVVGFNAEPVLLSYSGLKEIDDFIEQKSLERAEYEFSTTDLKKHELWVLSPEETTKIQQAFDALDAVYIADGHHRSASSVGLKKYRTENNLPQFPNEDFFLAFFINEQKVNILEFNRLAKTLNNHTEEEIVTALKPLFEVSSLPSAQKPSRAHEITMCIKGNWYLLKCKAEIIDENHPVKCLDAEILTQFVLDPILGICDLKTDDRIEFASGEYPLAKFEKKITQGDFKIGFVLYPLSIDEVKRVADNQMIMPPKSTWVEPKLRSGLTIYPINE